MAKKVLLKDILFNRAKVTRIASEIRAVYPSFKQREFVRDVIRKFPELELKARISWIAECLTTYLPSNYKRAVGILIKALPSSNNPELSDDDFGDFIYAPYAEFVAQNGCARERLDLSLTALYEITQRFSAEYAIRSFINVFPQKTLKQLLTWAEDPHYHVRRLCSEGTRPKLPWGKKINIPSYAPLPILDKLFFDTTRFVTRSVANHMNDISKIDADLAIRTLTKWKKTGKQKSAEMDYITRHALRTLIKQGHPGAMRALGFHHSPRVEISKLVVPKQVIMNTALDFSFTIASEKDIGVLVDYTLYFRNKVGTLKNKKVFKLTKLALIKNKPVQISKRHRLRGDMTSRVLYPGTHEIELQVNGKKYARTPFILK